MPTYVPYIVISLLSLAGTGLILARQRSWLVVVMYFVFAGIVYVFEIIVCVLLHSYDYHPGIVRDSYIDSMLGATASNFITVPTVATLIAVYQLRWRWIFFFACTFGLIDILFVRLGVYEHHWWKSLYTVFGLIIFFWVGRLMMRMVRAGQRFFQYIATLLFTFCFTDSTLFVLLLAGWRQFRPQFDSEASRDDVLMTIVVASFVTLVLVNTVFWANKMLYWVISWMIILAAQYMLYLKGILLIYVSHWLYAITYIGTLLILTVASILGLRTLRAAGQH